MLSLPATWATIYPESAALPRLGTPFARRAWLEAQSELGQRLKGLGLGLDDFVWSVRDTAVTDSGVRKPAVLAVGRSTIACVEREVMMPDPFRPWFQRRALASGQDELFFEWVASARPAERPLGENVNSR
jgi:hypothetical protein